MRLKRGDRMVESSARVGSRLPWAQDRAERTRFGVILLVVGILFLVPSLLIPGVELPERDRAESEQVPPRLARLIEKPAPVAPPPEPLTQEPEPVPEPVDELPTPPEAAEVVEVPAPTLPAPVQSADQARETAARSGLFAMKNQLAALTRPGQDVPATVREINVSSDHAGALHEQVPDRVQALAGSGGVEISDAPAREVLVAQHEVSQVAAPVNDVEVARSKPAPQSSVGQRAMSNIRQVFDAQKSVLYSLYQRELRQDPTLEGRVTLELVIEPDGSVSACQVVGSELGSPALEQRIAMRVRMFNFGAADVETRKVQFPIEFLPG